MMKRIHAILVISAFILAVYSYGFIDPHLSFSTHPLYVFLVGKLTHLVYQQSVAAAALYVCIIGVLFAGYGIVLRAARREKRTPIPFWMIPLVGILLLSYPAFSYDIYNYIATAKVTFLYRENPYVVMPIEIPNEPMLSFTRAANKVALYGPVWIVLTSFPYLIGQANTFATVVAFKTFAALFYGMVTYMIYRKTKRWDQALFFAANPLVLTEVLVSGHNDIVMMALALGGLLLWSRKSTLQNVAGIVLFASSVLIKGATIVLLPLFFLRSWDWKKKMLLGSTLMFAVFLVSPLREEMYPWYAVWWLSLVAFVPRKKNSFIHGFSFWLSLGLMLRYVPWIATREYGGITPGARIILTLVPVMIYVVYWFRGNAKHFLASLKKNI